VAGAACRRSQHQQAPRLARAADRPGALQRRPRLLEASLANLGRLQAERAILVTKAVSWLLRNLSIRHRDVAARYLDENRAALPAIAVREVSAKLQTGRKALARTA
jgi:hypothetical protein